MEPVSRVFFRSLGCPKNQVDTEVMLGALALGGYAVAERVEDAEIAVINTCAFIESAREESIAAILEVADRKEAGALRAVVVTGCLPQRYGQELARELPEVDAFIGTGDFPRVAQIIDRALSGAERGVYVDAGRTHLYDETQPRMLIGPGHSAYLKIAEGCDRVCAFCAIPGIRGKFQSRTSESIIQEAHALGQGGVRELNLISQDTTSYGKDLYGRPVLHDLIRALDEVADVDWIRLLYLYPTAVTDDVIDAIADAQRVLHYVDMPLQHASDPVLRNMKRGVTADRQRTLVAKLRERVPDVVLRTTFIVGFPGETDADFASLCEFVREQRFDRVGLFRYSDEDQTTAASYADKVPRDVARKRYDTLQSIQREIMTEAMEARVGDPVQVLIDKATPGMAVGRLASQAPEIDGLVFLSGADATPGDLIQARITGVRNADFTAEVSEGDSPRPPTGN